MPVSVIRVGCREKPPKLKRDGVTSMAQEVGTDGHV